MSDDGTNITISNQDSLFICPKCKTIHSKKEPPIIEKREKYIYQDFIPVSFFIEDDRPKCRGCGVRFNIIIYYET